ncbi:MAG TPA: M13 family metallopeptidase [Ferruginibacter sp.]|nr:M13 family metallopeptidase [Ferruginibacter sp.]
MNKVYVAITLLAGILITQNCKSQFLDLKAMDTTVRPGDNFWLYANGNWNKTAVIPPTENSTGSFFDLRKKSRDAMQSLCEAAAISNAPLGSVKQKVGDMYASGMDTITIDKLGYAPLQPFLQEINNISDTKAIMAFVTTHHAMGDAMLYGFGIEPDDKNAGMNICGFYQAGLGLPEKDYYFSNDPKIIEQRKAYVAYISKLFELTGDNSSNAAKNAATVLAFETRLAGGHSSNVELRDPVANYHKMGKADLMKLAPHIDWPAVFTELKITTDSFDIGQPRFYQTLDSMLTSISIKDWKQYLRFHEINNHASQLSKDFADAAFEFYGKILSGQQKQKPRGERMASIVDGTLGEALGQLYVQKYFTDSAKQRMLKLVNNLQQVYSKRIQALDWMSDATKVKAEAKLAAFLKKIGFPDKWKEYKTDIKRNDFFGNNMRLAQFAYDDQIIKQGKPVDKMLWGMTPPTINAYYNQNYNEIVFPAGILQFPFFDPNADDAINYGGIGMVIGHEMTHGFDDQGSQYDKDGNLNNWWAPDDKTKFDAKTAAVVAQYNAYTVLDSLHINGKLTLGENLADIGGVTIAYEAFKNTEEGKKNETIDGFTAEQRFFLSIAQIWRMKSKDATILQRIKVDPHSPAMWRVNGPLSDFTPWYNAFNVKPGDKMYKPVSQRIQVW